MADTTPLKIVSLVPSLTELLYSLNLDEEVVGITRFCVHPPHWRQQKMRIGGTKDPDLKTIISLRPTLIIANKEENRKEDIAFLQKHTRVLLTDINSLDEAIEAIGQIGKAVHCVHKALSIANEISLNFKNIIQTENVKCAYLIWQNPMMAVGHDTFIEDLLHRLGYINVFGHLSRYPVITSGQLAEAKPDVIFLSSEPYPFNEKHVPIFEQMAPDSKVICVDGEMFSWYGSRLILAADYFRQLRDKVALIDG
jgi:ABC-type Fe3+-hydroxamate transport system substrate-binding protein